MRFFLFLSRFFYCLLLPRLHAMIPDKSCLYDGGIRHICPNRNGLNLRSGFQVHRIMHVGEEWAQKGLCRVLLRESRALYQYIKHSYQFICTGEATRSFASQQLLRK